MNRLIVLCLCVLLAGCSQKSNGSGGAQKIMEARVAEVGERSKERHIAYSYGLSYEAPKESLMQRFDAIEAECIKLGCMILSASRANGAAGNPPSAELEARIPPAALASFLRSTAAANTLTHQTRTSEDKTIAVIDADAKITNLTALRARILQLLEQRAGNLADVLAAEAQLSEIQSELDTIQAVRKVLALETEMVKVELRLTAQSSVGKASWLHPVATAADEAGDVLANSLALLVMFLVGLVPWLIVIIPSVWFLRKWLRKRRLRREAAGA